MVFGRTLWGRTSVFKFLRFVSAGITALTIGFCTTQAQSVSVTFDLSTGPQGVVAQFDVLGLVNGVTFSSPSLSNISPHSVESNVIASNATRFIVYSTSNSPMSTSGVVTATMSVTAPSSFQDGMISVQNVIVSDTNGNIVAASPDALPLIISTAPASYRSVQVGVPTALSVQAIDPDGEISSVALRLNGIPQAVTTARPFTLAWSPYSSGAYTFDAIAIGGHGKVATTAEIPLRAYALSEINSFSQFTAIHFGPNSSNPAVVGTGDDPLGIGISNLLAYLLGINPWDPNLAALPHLTRGSSGSFALLFQLSPFATGVSYQILQTPSLSPAEWSPLIGAPTIQTNLSNGLVQEVVTVTSGTHPSEFYELDVQGNAP
jgi:Big-like domain-containing protein